MITIDSLDEVQAANGCNLHIDEDSRGDGFCISPENRCPGSTSSSLVKTTCGRLVIQCGLFFIFVFLCTPCVAVQASGSVKLAAAESRP
jgi:hypothetical protein